MGILQNLNYFTIFSISHFAKSSRVGLNPVRGPRAVCLTPLCRTQQHLTLQHITLGVVLDCEAGGGSLGLDPTSDRKLAQRSSDFFFWLSSSSCRPPGSFGCTSSCGAGCASSAPPPSFSSPSTFRTPFFLFLRIVSKIPENKGRRHSHHLFFI